MKKSLLVRSVLIAVAMLASPFLPAAPARAGLPAAPVCGDVNDNGTVASSDALLVLRKAVGQPVTLTCGQGLVLARYGLVDLLPATSNFSPGYLLGTPVIIGKNGLLTHLGVHGLEVGPNVRLALYTDAAGSPGTLVAGTKSAALAVGSQELPVVATEVKAGTYWLLANFNASAKIGFEATNSTTEQVRFIPLGLSDPLPETFGLATGYTGQRFNFWVRTVE